MWNIFVVILVLSGVPASLWGMCADDLSEEALLAPVSSVGRPLFLIKEETLFSAVEAETSFRLVSQYVFELDAASIERLGIGRYDIAFENRYKEELCYSLLPHNPTGDSGLLTIQLAPDVPGKHPGNVYGKWQRTETGVRITIDLFHN